MKNPSNPALLALLASVLLISTGCSKSSEGEVVDASGKDRLQVQILRSGESVDLLRRR